MDRLGVYADQRNIAVQGFDDNLVWWTLYSYYLGTQDPHVLE
jgi:hypothetical protein